MRRINIRDISLIFLDGIEDNNPKVKTPLYTENYKYMDSISFNIIQIMTKFKNQEISPLSLNKILFGNLSLFTTQKNIQSKKSKTKNISKEFLPPGEYGLYIPTNRIPCLFYNEENKDFDCENNHKLLLYKRPKINIPFNREFINCFRPLGRNFMNINVEKLNIQNNEDSNIYNKEKYDRSKSLALNDSMSLNDNASFLSDFENLSINSDIFNDSSSFISKVNTDENFNKNQKEQMYQNYYGLVDYMECPFIKNNKDDKTIFEILKDIEKIDDEIILNNNTYTIYINNFNNSIVQEIDEEFLDKKIIIPKNTKNSKVKKEKNGGEHLFAFFKYYDKDIDAIKSTSSRKSVNLQKKKNNNTVIKPFLEAKYINQMNKKYIIFIYKFYKRIIKECKKNKILNAAIPMKKLFINWLKKFLLLNGICSKNIISRILKYLTYNNELTFEKFLQCFDIILNQTDINGIKEKLLFLFSIISPEDDFKNDTYNDKDISNFFELLSCSLSYVQDFSEILGEKLISRYNTIYIDDCINIGGEYCTKKLKLILDSFFEQFLNDE